MSDDSSALLPPSLPPQPFFFFVCLPGSPGVSSSAGPETLPWGIISVLKCEFSVSFETWQRAGARCWPEGEGMCLKAAPPGASSVLLPCRGFCLDFFFFPFCCHFHCGFPFHPLSTSPAENRSVDLWPAKGYLSHQGGGTEQGE